MATTVFAPGSSLRRLTVENELDAEALSTLKADTIYKLEIVQPKGTRSIRQHRLLFGLIRIVKDNTPVEPALTSKTILNVLKLRTGHVNVVSLPSGEVVMTPASIAFEAMPQDEFNPWFEKALAVMCRDFLPGLSVEAARREIEAVAFGHGQRRAA